MTIHIYTLGQGLFKKVSQSSSAVAYNQRGGLGRIVPMRPIPSDDNPRGGMSIKDVQTLFDKVKEF